MFVSAWAPLLPAAKLCLGGRSDETEERRGEEGMWEAQCLSSCPRDLC